MLAQVWFMPVDWNWLNNLCCFLFGKGFFKVEQARIKMRKRKYRLGIVVILGGGVSPPHLKLIEYSKGKTPYGRGQI